MLEFLSARVSVREQKLDYSGNHAWKTIPEKYSIDVLVTNRGAASYLLTTR
jgi:hypothetical protein